MLEAMSLLGVPEPSRHLRHRLRVRLGWAGFAPFGPGVWISPWASRESEATTFLADLGLVDGATVFVSQLGAAEDPRALAGRAWDLDRVEVDWRHFPAADPDLPGELLDRSWPGGEAATLFHDRHRAWAPAARAWWADHA